MENLRIKFVKFYQGVQVSGTSNQTSVKPIYVKSVSTPKLITIEHTADGIMVITELESGSEYTLVPYNNVAYVNHEVISDSEQKPKATAMKPLKSSLESK